VLQDLLVLLFLEELLGRSHLRDDDAGVGGRLFELIGVPPRDGLVDRVQPSPRPASKLFRRRQAVTSQADRCPGETLDHLPARPVHLMQVGGSFRRDFLREIVHDAVRGAN
jgi:hypothetical protein